MANRKNPTLRQLLEDLQMDEVTSKRLQQEYVPEKTREEILRDFFKAHPLSYAVAQQQDSYFVRVKPIEVKFATHATPKPDRIFDLEVERLFDSMNKVGIRYLNSADYQTSLGQPAEDRTDIFFFSGLVGTVGAGIGALFWPRPLNAAIGAGVGAGIGYLIAESGFYSTRMDDLKKLRKTAIDTDRFLVKNYIPV